MKTKQIMIKGHGPQGTAAINGNLYADGAVLELPENQANAYIQAGLALPILSKEDEQKVAATRNQIKKNTQRRKEVIEKTTKKEGEKS